MFVSGVCLCCIGRDLCGGPITDPGGVIPNVCVCLICTVNTTFYTYKGIGTKKYVISAIASIPSSVYAVPFTCLISSCFHWLIQGSVIFPRHYFTKLSKL